MEIADEGIISRQDLFEVWRSESDTIRRNSCVLDYILNRYNLKDCSNDVRASVKRISDDFCLKVKKRWLSNFRVLSKFMSKNSTWLQRVLKFPDIVSNSIARSRQSSRSSPASQYEVLKQLKLGKDTLPQLTAIFKWGCDGASGQSTYKQLYNDEEGDDSFLFLISLVPLQIHTHSNAGTSRGGNQMIVWQNPRASLTRYCRPIKIHFKKETAELTREEVSNMKAKIHNLIPTKVEIEGREILVEHKLAMTMVNGKVCATLTEQSTQNCFICGATPKTMNNFKSHSNKNVNPSSLSYGLSCLHAWIRCFECLLHISYILQVKSWQIRKSDRERVEMRKREIQGRFRREMGLLIDIPQPGSGTTNDGNSARRFFANPKLTSSITGLDVDLIRRFSVILKTIASGFDINVSAFESYAMTTAKMYVALYEWYYMPASVHKILIHGGSIIQTALLPMGQLSEEAQEARHKDCKRFREGHTRKFSRRNTIDDLLHMLLITSDPIISNLRYLPKKKSETLPFEVVKLLLERHEQAIKHTEGSASEQESSSESDDSFDF